MIEKLQKIPVTLNVPIPLQILIGLLLALIIIGLPFMLKYRDGFFGWNNFKWLIVELRKMYSNDPSHFSYKRFQMGSAFFMYSQGSMYALSAFVTDMATFIVWATPNLLIAGYTLNKIQKENAVTNGNTAEEK